MAKYRLRAAVIALGGCVLLASGAQARPDNEASPTTMIADMARELIHKSYSNSQVSEFLINILTILWLCICDQKFFCQQQYFGI